MKQSVDKINYYLDIAGTVTEAPAAEEFTVR